MELWGQFENWVEALRNRGNLGENLCEKDKPWQLSAFSYSTEDQIP